MASETKPTIEVFTLTGCFYNGVACMDCIEGQCEAIGQGLSDVEIEYHRCTACGSDDVYGEIIHEDDCPVHREEQTRG